MLSNQMRGRAIRIWRDIRKDQQHLASGSRSSATLITLPGEEAWTRNPGSLPRPQNHDGWSIFLDYLNQESETGLDRLDFKAPF